MSEHKEHREEESQILDLAFPEVSEGGLVFSFVLFGGLIVFAAVGGYLVTGTGLLSEVTVFILLIVVSLFRYYLFVDRLVTRFRVGDGRLYLRTRSKELVIDLIQVEKATYHPLPHGRTRFALTYSPPEGRSKIVFNIPAQTEDLIQVRQIIIDRLTSEIPLERGSTWRALLSG